ncbi:MAG: glycosyltransferase family 2 protein, partial [Acidimicrobiaceae bacterium]|nr:glycosyltransferase family 2 protein [Acidimicrobiaceae bacterium]
MVGPALLVESGPAQRHGLGQGAPLPVVAVVAQFLRLRVPCQPSRAPVLHRCRGRRVGRAVLQEVPAAGGALVAASCGAGGDGRHIRGGVRGDARGTPVERPDPALLLPHGVPDGRPRRGRVDRMGPLTARPPARSPRRGRGTRRGWPVRGPRGLPHGRRLRCAGRGRGAGHGGAAAAVVARRQARRRRRVPLGTPQLKRLQSRLLLGAVQLRGLRGPPADRGRRGKRRVLGPCRHHGPCRREPGVWPVAVGVRLRPSRLLRHADGSHAAAVLDRPMHRLHGGPLLRGVGHDAVPLPDAVRDVGCSIPGPARPALRRTRCRPGDRAPAGHGCALLHGLLGGRGAPGPGRARAGGGGVLRPVGRLRGGSERARDRAGQAAGGRGRRRPLQRLLAGSVGGRVPGRRPRCAAAGGRRTLRMAEDGAAGHARGVRRRGRVRQRCAPGAGDAPAGRAAAGGRAPLRCRAGGGERCGPPRPLHLVLRRPGRGAGAGAHLLLPQLVGIGCRGAVPRHPELHGGGAHRHRGAPRLRAQRGGVDRARDHARGPGRRRVDVGAEGVWSTVRLSVVVPAYREAGRIGETVATLRSELAPVHHEGGVEIVVVDDGSDDGTAAAGRAAGADVVVEFPVNRGKGAAVRAGMRIASGSVVAFTDADLSYPPHQILGLLEEVEQGADAAVGDRRHPDSVAVTDASWLRRTRSRAVA